MKTLVAIALAVASAFAYGQAGAMDEIDDAFQSRLANQSDKWFEDGHFPILLHMLRVQQEWSPLDEEIATDLGWMYKNLEQPAMEWLTYVRYSKRNPGDKDHLYPVANFYFMAKSYVNVVATLSGIEKQDPPPHPNCFRMLAHSYSRLGLHKDALRIWEAYIKVAPDDLQAKNNRQKVADIISGKTKPTATVPANDVTGPGKKPVKPPKPPE